MTGYESTMGALEARLRAAPANWGLGVNEYKRVHRTSVARDKTPAVHLVDGDDEPVKNVCGRRVMKPSVSVYLRKDDFASVIDALKAETYRRLNPETTGAAYPAGAMLTPGAIRIDAEIADADAVRIDLEFEVQYPTGAEWTL